MKNRKITVRVNLLGAIFGPDAPETEIEYTFKAAQDSAIYDSMHPDAQPACWTWEIESDVPCEDAQEAPFSTLPKTAQKIIVAAARDHANDFDYKNTAYLSPAQQEDFDEAMEGVFEVSESVKAVPAWHETFTFHVLTYVVFAGKQYRHDQHFRVEANGVGCDVELSNIKVRSHLNTNQFRAVEVDDLPVEVIEAMKARAIALSQGLRAKVESPTNEDFVIQSFVARAGGDGSASDSAAAAYPNSASKPETIDTPADRVQIPSAA